MRPVETGMIVAISSLLALPPASAEDRRSFVREVRPILVGRCLDCHSGDKPAGGLDMSTRERLLKGGKSGRVVEPGDADASSLLDAVAEGVMPPKKGDRLGEAEIATLRGWIVQGAPWDAGPISPGMFTTDRRAGLDWWSLQPIVRPAVPVGADGSPLATNAIDAFVLRKLSEQKLTPSPEADRRTLIRRMTFDLHGLPPSPGEIDAFENDRRPGMVERLVDRLLASPRYGERWGRHWLDVVRFAESHGYEHDSPRFGAWAYRDSVIEGLNDDIPYDRFVAEQIAGDVLAPKDERAVAASGFLVAGPYDEVGSKVASAIMRANVRQDELEDLIGVVGQAFLGLTVQCARCHNHKFDPIPQEDFYRIEAAFAGVKHGGDDFNKKPVYLPKREKPEATKVLNRGDVLAPGREVAPGALRAVGALDSGFDVDAKADESARRVALTKWLTDRRNPLTARVMANRVWQHHFGQGIVATPSDFGFNGVRPTHPELLDWLASELMDGGWKLKRLHRLILLSDAYRRSSRFDPAAAAVDSDNRWLWRFSPRRLDAEEVRDTLLLISGQLNETRGGPGYQLFDSRTNAGTLYKPVDKDGPEYRRRSIYRMVVRGAENPLLTTLDCPEPSTTTPTRAVTTTPLQALSLWNDRFVHRQSAAFAGRLEHDAPDTGSRIRLAYRLAFGREPKKTEQAEAERFAKAQGLGRLCHVLINANEFLIIE